MKQQTKVNPYITLTHEVLGHMEHMAQGRQKGGILLAGDPGVGKAQPINAKVLTSTGWTTMGDLKVGDQVMTPSGEAVAVLKTFPQGKKDIYTITFHDGSKTECCLEHLWKVYASKYSTCKATEQVISTQELISLQKKMKEKGYNNNISIPMISSIEQPAQPLPIAPYVLGALIGDGTFTGSSPRITSADPEIINRVANLLDEQLTVKQISNIEIEHLIVQKNPKHLNVQHAGMSSNSLMVNIRQLGLNRRGSHEKFIPEIYKRGSIEQRKELLRGLLDTDGTAGKKNGISFCSTSFQLIKDVQEIVWSLGGCASISNRFPTYDYKGSMCDGRPAYDLHIAIENPSELFSLERKKIRCLNKFGDERVTLRRRLKSIEHTSYEEAKCILIDHPDHLYITDDYIVTHNTTYVEILASLLGMKAVVVEVPHITEEHLINIPFIVFNPQNNSTSHHASQMTHDYKLVLAQSNLFSQVSNAPTMGDAQYIAHIKAAPGYIQEIYKALGGTEQKIPREIEAVRKSHNCILFLDEFFRLAPMRIRNILRGILNNKIGLHQIPKAVYVMYASNMNDPGGLEEIPSNYQFQQMEFKTPSKNDWFDWLISKFKDDHRGVKLNESVIEMFKKILKDEDMSHTDVDKDVRTSPRRWENLLLYINSSLPIEDKEAGRALITNVKNNFINYQSGEHGKLNEKVLDGVIKLIRQMSNIDLDKGNTLEPHEWRSALKHLIKKQMELGENRKYIPVVSGPPGIGKTTEALKIANDFNLRLIDIDVSELNSDDVIGMPIPGSRTEHDITVQFSHPKLYQQIETQIREQDAAYAEQMKEQHGTDANKYIESYKRQQHKYLIFFDEINRTDEKTFNALRKVILEKNFGPKGDNSGELLKLPKGSVVVAAMNPEGVGTAEMTHHFKDVIDVVPAKASWNDTRKWLLGQTYKGVSDQIRDVAMNIVDAFVKKFKSTDNKYNAHTAPFHLNVGSELYISPREYTDMFSILVRKLNKGIKEILADPDIKQDEVRELADKIVGDSLEMSLSFVFQKHQIEKEEFINTLKNWVQTLDDSVFAGMLTKKIQHGHTLAGSISDFLDGKDLENMPESIHIINANNTVNNAQFIEEIKDAFASKLTDAQSVNKYVIEENHPKVTINNTGKITRGSEKASLVTNFMIAFLQTLHTHQFTNDRITSIGRGLSVAASEVINKLHKSGKIDDDLKQDASIAIATLRSEIHEMIGELK